MCGRRRLDGAGGSDLKIIVVHALGQEHVCDDRRHIEAGSKTRGVVELQRAAKPVRQAPERGNALRSVGARDRAQTLGLGPARDRTPPPQNGTPGAASRRRSVCRRSGGSRWVCTRAESPRTFSPTAGVGDACQADLRMVLGMRCPAPKFLPPSPAKCSHPGHRNIGLHTAQHMMH